MPSALIQPLCEVSQREPMRQVPLLVLFLVVLGLNLLLLLNYWVGLSGCCYRMGIVPALRHSQPVFRQP